MENVTFDSASFKKEVLNLVDTVQSRMDTGELWELEHDLLQMVFTEFIASEQFSKMDGERRRDLFNQYTSLKLLLKNLDGFVEKYPSNLDTIKFQAACFE